MDIDKDIKFGPHTLRIRKQKGGFAGIIVGQSSSPEIAATAEQVRDLLIKRCGEQAPDFVGLAGARARFLKLFPNGFLDAKFIGDGKFEGERAYKLLASEQLRNVLPLSSVANAADEGLIALRAMQKTNLLDPFTKAKLGEVLRGQRASEFIRLVADFAEGEIDDSCASLNRHFQNEGVNTWVCLTYFPFLWKPESHMFLKPEFTRTFAERIGHRFQFDYETRPNPKTYASLLHLTDTVRAALSDMQPKDNIDIHSFMWATVEYLDSDVGL
ncbi:MAG: hypothetical protein V4753_04530 [Pseudomonadota bacterium]